MKFTERYKFKNPTANKLAAMGIIATLPIWGPLYISKEVLRGFVAFPCGAFNPKTWRIPEFKIFDQDMFKSDFMNAPISVKNVSQLLGLMTGCVVFLAPGCVFHLGRIGIREVKGFYDDYTKADEAYNQMENKISERSEDVVGPNYERE